MRTLEITEGGMSDKEFAKKKDLTARIMKVANSVAVPVDANMLFSLVFCSVPELRKIAKKLGA